jgi:hypothetical protein
MLVCMYVCRPQTPHLHPLLVYVCMFMYMCVYVYVYYVYVYYVYVCVCMEWGTGEKSIKIITFNMRTHTLGERQGVLVPHSLHVWLRRARVLELWV